MSSQPPLASNMLTLICWVIGDKSAFPVDISPEKTFGHLKKAIVAQKPNRCHGIDADTLMLWKKYIVSRERRNFQESELHDQDQLDEVDEIDGYFKEAPPQGELVYYIIYTCI